MSQFSSCVFILAKLGHSGRQRFAEAGTLYELIATCLVQM